MTTRSAINLLALSLFACMHGPAIARQVFNVEDGVTVLAKISVKEPSRITVEGQFIRASTVDEESVIIHRDDKDPQGHIFVKAKDPKRHATIFLSTDTAAYAVLLQPADIPAETIILRDRSRRDPPKLEMAASRIKAAKSLILSMARDDAADMEVVDHRRMEFALWQEARLTLDRSWLGQALIGERWHLTNVSPVRMTVLEQELFKPGIVAVAIEAQNIDPGQVSNIYVVRERGANE